MSTVLVTGGAGYIGSHTVRNLLGAGHEVIVIDNLYSGHRWAIDPSAQFIEGDIGDASTLKEVFSRHPIEAVVHFAGHIVVPESVENPLKYHQNNVAGSLTLIESCIESGINRFLFSSSAAVYGNPEAVPVTESAPTMPINPYGSTKLMTEWMLRDIAAANDNFEYVALRYFNVAGAHDQGDLGQATPMATHLIKVACEVAVGKRSAMSIFGDDYPTEDGTCIRDYIHVQDLAQAHVDALTYLEDGGDSVALNCGYGRGFSVRQVVDCVKQISGVDFSVAMAERRSGDPAELIANNDKIREVLGWQPERNDLELICHSAYQWERYMASREYKN